MIKKRAKNVAINVFVRMKKPYYQGVAAELAFFFLMSMVPLFIMIGEFLGVFSLSLDVLEGLIGQYVSQEMADSLKEYINYKPSGTMGAFFLIFALWSASKAQFSMIRIANYTYTGLNSGRGFIWERIRAMVTVVITILLLVFSLTILVYGEPIINIVALYAERILFLPFTFNELWYIVRWPIAIAFYFVGITFINYILPSERMSLKKIIPGSLLTSSGILVVTWVYSIYATGFSNYDLFYGSLASVIGLLFWFYILGYVIVLGIVLNAALIETKV